MPHTTSLFADAADASAPPLSLHTPIRESGARQPPTGDRFRRGWRLGVAALGLVMASATAMAQGATGAGTPATTTAETASQAAKLPSTCHADPKGDPVQSARDCRRETAAAGAESAKGTLVTNGSDDPAVLEANRLKRCERLPADQRADCVRMASGLGEVSGSVNGGGQLKSLTTRTVGEPGSR